MYLTFRSETPPKLSWRTTVSPSRRWQTLSTVAHALLAVLIGSNQKENALTDAQLIGHQDLAWGTDIILALSATSAC
jgi:hypothetical protein